MTNREVYGSAVISHRVSYYSHNRRIIMAIKSRWIKWKDFYSFVLSLFNDAVNISRLYSVKR
jgi:hypothetical protein